MTDEPARAHYDRLAPDWHRIGTPDPDPVWEALRERLPPVAGCRILDAGCGSGEYAARLAADGADVVGVDFSPEMIAQAGRRHGDAATFRQADLTDGLPGLPADDFDAVVCKHALSHVRDIDAVFETFARVLGPEGVAVMSTHHPQFYFQVVRERHYPAVETPDGATLQPTVTAEAGAPTYHETERFQIVWGDTDTPAPYYRRPLSSVFDAVTDAGFAVDSVREPPAGGDELIGAIPEALCVRAALR